MNSVFEFLALFVEIFGQIMTIAIFARALMSWFPISPENALVQFLISITDPILLPLRRIIPAVMMFDLTPMIAILLFSIFTPMAANILRSLG